MARVRRTKLVHCLPQALRPDSPSRQVQQALVPSSLFHQIIQLYVFDTGKYLDYFTSKGLNEVGGKNCQSGLKKLVIDPVFWPDFYCLKTSNRGQVSKIFDELFFALDPDYRGEDGRVETQYQNMVPIGDYFKYGFYVPENVYVIGTMNDIDHSLEPLDFAFRRRFAWHEITAAERFNGMFNGDEPFKLAPEFVKKVKLYFDRLNTAIGGNDSGLGAEYQVGPAYFLKLKNFIKGISDLNAANEDQVKGWMAKLWDNHLKPLLQEYLKVNNDTSLTLKDLEAAYYGTDKKQG